MCRGCGEGKREKIWIAKKGGVRSLEGCMSEGVSEGKELRSIDAGEGK